MQKTDNRFVTFLKTGVHENYTISFTNLQKKQNLLEMRQFMLISATSRRQMCVNKDHHHHHHGEDGSRPERPLY